MSKFRAKQVPIVLNDRGKTDVRTQFGALCYRVIDDKVKVLMITSRGTGRWIIPKGWPADGKTPIESALTEAWEEAGVKGRVTGDCLGLFSYQKNVDDADELPCVAMVYPVKVKTLAANYPEKGERRRRWMTLKRAAEKVNEPELARILKSFDPERLRG
ncbi:MAG: NUDIX hydrolase [Pseudomonadota bacterium]